MCIFCKIINSEIPSYKVYEDEQVLAFLDVKPVNPGHTLVIPKTHYQNIEEISAENLRAVIVVVKEIGRRLKEKLHVAGYNVIVNNDPVAGQVVPHLHFHVIPRHEGDSELKLPQKEYSIGEAEKVVEKLIS